MNKIVLLGINSKFVHTNIAIRYIKKYVENNSGFKLNILEKTINNHIEEIISEIYREKPEILILSAGITADPVTFVSILIPPNSPPTNQLFPISAAKTEDPTSSNEATTILFFIHILLNDIN